MNNEMLTYNDFCVYLGVITTERMNSRGRINIQSTKRLRGQRAQKVRQNVVIRVPKGENWVTLGLLRQSFFFFPGVGCFLGGKFSLLLSWGYTHMMQIMDNSYTNHSDRAHYCEKPKAKKQQDLKIEFHFSLLALHFVFPSWIFQISDFRILCLTLVLVVSASLSSSTHGVKTRTYCLMKVKWISLYKAFTVAPGRWKALKNSSSTSSSRQITISSNNNFK